MKKLLFSILLLVSIFMWCLAPIALFLFDNTKTAHASSEDFIEWTGKQSVSDDVTIRVGHNKYSGDRVYLYMYDYGHREGSMVVIPASQLK